MPDLARLFSGIAERRADLDLARLPIRDSIQIVDPNRGRGQQFHGVENPSEVPFHPESSWLPTSFPFTQTSAL